MGEAKGCSRRRVLRGTPNAVIAAAIGLGGLTPARFAIGAAAKVKVGMLLPQSGAYAALGEAVNNGFRLGLAEMGGLLGGRAVEITSVDSQANPAKAAANADRLINGDSVDFLVGPVHSGVAVAVLRAVRDGGPVTVIANAGLGAATGDLCAPHVFRTSFSNWQTAYPMGEVAVQRGLRRVVSVAWNYAAGHEMLDAFGQGLTQAGGRVAKRILLPFPVTGFQDALAEIASLRPDGVFAFFAGDGAAAFVRAYASAGLKDIPLMGPGFLTEGQDAAEGAAAEGILTTLHYADDLDNPENKAFRAAYAGAYGRPADVYAVQGYDSAQLIGRGMAAVKGDIRARGPLLAAMENATIKSPRGTFTLSKAHNPVQDIYLRQVRGGRQVVLGVAARALADPAKGCRTG